MDKIEINKILEKQVKKSDTEKVSIIDAIGRVCAKKILARMDIPSFSKSKYDGFIIHDLDYSLFLEKRNLTLKCLGKIGAGHSLKKNFEPGTTYNIMTGAEIPSGTHYVIPFEAVMTNRDKQVIINAIDLNLNTIIYRGSKIKKGHLLLDEGSTIGSRSIFEITDQGYEYIDVYRKPNVSIISTGDEIIKIGMPYDKGKIYNSTSYALAADVIKNGGHIFAIDHVGDNTQKIVRSIKHYLLDSDIIITTGGMGGGSFDYTKEVFKYIHSTIVYEFMDQAPRIIISKIDNKWILHLSGSPNATFISMDRAIVPIIDRMLGRVRYSKTNI